MRHPLESLHTLAERMRRGSPEARQRLRHELEDSLVPLIRSAIRGGIGMPQLVSWVRRHLPAAPAGTSPESVAPSLAHLLCDTLLRQYQPRPTADIAARETVRDW